MISKELLSEVLNKECYNIYLDKNIVSFEIELVEKVCMITEEINIYELAHKCKEWAYGLLNKYWFSVWKDKNTYYLNLATVDFKHCNNEAFIADSEPEAIFKACQWIIEDKKCLKQHTIY